MDRKTTPRVLTIAGSDSSGGAGIQADLKTFQALECYGMSVITVLTAQNTVTVRSIFPASPEFVEDQINAVFEDIGVNAIKIGMLYLRQIIQTVAVCLGRFRPRNVVLDPVMIAKAGSRLLQDDSVDALREFLFPMTDILTPNIPEAEILSGISITNRTDMEIASKILLKSVRQVVIKGGHLGTSKNVFDLYANKGGEMTWIEYPRIETRNTHGTGCTFSAATASYLAKGFDSKNSVLKAREYLQSAIIAGSNNNLGKGCGPVEHSWNLRR